MTNRLREAARDALQVMEQCGYLEQRWEAEQLRAALAEQEAEPVQEPVAWRYRYEDGRAIFRDEKPDEYDIEWAARRGIAVEPLCAHPPRREWRGLTDEEIDALWGDQIFTDAQLEYRRIWTRVIESALKEKNA